MKKPSADQLLAAIVVLTLAIAGYQAMNRQMDARAKCVVQAEEKTGGCAPGSVLESGASVIWDSMTGNLLYIVF